MIWKSVGDGVRRKYDFSYDATNRFMKAEFEQNSSTSNWDAAMDYTVMMGNGIDPLTAYDANGNIKRMQQFGWMVTGSDRIDDLYYSYSLQGTGGERT